MRADHLSIEIIPQFRSDPDIAVEVNDVPVIRRLGEETIRDFIGIRPQYYIVFADQNLAQILFDQHIPYLYMTQITANLTLAQVPKVPIVPLKTSLSLHLFEIKGTSVNSLNQTGIL
jgi:hypothetical protein